MGIQQILLQLRQVESVQTEAGARCCTPGHCPPTHAMAQAICAGFTSRIFTFTNTIAPRLCNQWTHTFTRIASTYWVNSKMKPTGRFPKLPQQRASRGWICHQSGETLRRPWHSASWRSHWQASLFPLALGGLKVAPNTVKEFCVSF